MDLDFSAPMFDGIDYLDFEEIWETLGVRIVVTPHKKCAQTRKPRLFNTAAPTCGDSDLFSADESRAIVIQADGTCAEPDDCRFGGEVKFEFKQRMEVQSIKILDVDDDVKISGTHLLGGTFDLGYIPRAGNGNHVTFDVNKKNVVEFVVTTSGSTAINRLKYVKCDPGGNGDPHFQSWTGYKFDYHGQCDLALLSAPNHSAGGLNIQVRTTQRDFYSYISAVAMQLGESIMEVTYDGIFIDGALMKLKGSTEFEYSGFKATFDDSPSETGRKQTVIEVHTGSYEHITIKIFDKYMAVRVWNPEYRSFIGATGLMGDYNTGKLIGRDGVSEFEDADLWGQHWQVNDSDVKLFSTTQEPQFPAQCVPAPEMNTGRKLRHGITEAQARKACASAGDVEDCVFDVMATGDIHMVGAHTW